MAQQPATPPRSGFVQPAAQPDARRQRRAPGSGTLCDKATEMNNYKKSVFDALMWGQGVENLVLDIILKCVANGALKISDAHLENTKNKHGLSQLADTLKPCIDDELYVSIKALAQDRNDVAHRSADEYMKSVLCQVGPEKIDLWRQ